MNYWEDFFSLDKIKYPFISSLLMGIFYFVISYAISINFSEDLFYGSVGLGFIFGNLYKIKIIQKEREIKRKVRKKRNKVI